MTSILNGFKVDVAQRSKTAMAGACYWFAMHYGCQSYPLPWLKNKKVDQFDRDIYFLKPTPALQEKEKMQTDRR